MTSAGPIDEATLVRRRRAIMHALARTLPREQALEAIAMWNRDYRHGRSAFDGLNLYARRVCAKFDRVGMHIELLQRLTQAFYVEERDLPQDPGPATQAPGLAPGTPTEDGDAETTAEPVAEGDFPPPRPAAAHRVGPPPEVATWLAVVRQLARELGAHDGPAAASMPRAVLGAAVQNGVDLDARDLIRLALEDRFSPRLDRLRTRELHTLLNIAYVHAVNAVGPVLADRLLSAAVHAVEGTAEGAAFPPRRLL